MHSRVVYDNNKDTLRVRAGRAAFTTEEGFGISRKLSSKKGINQVITSSANGSIYIKYSCKKNKVLKYIANIKKSDLFEAEASVKELTRDINYKYNNEIFKRLVTRYFIKIFLPTPIYVIKTLYDSTPYLIKGLNSIINLRLNMELLNATTLFISISKGNFNSANSVTFMFGLLKVLEDYALERKRLTLKNNHILNTYKVWIKNNDRLEVQIPLIEIKKGDKVVVKTGTIIPVDGIIISGSAKINEVIITGETEPILKKEEEVVYAGTIVENGSIIVKVEAINESTRINQIVNLIIFFKNFY